MLPPNAHLKGFHRFGLTRLRSMSSHGTECTPSHGIIQKAPFHSKIPIPTGSIRQTGARRRYISQGRVSFPGLAVLREPHHALGCTVTRLGGSICYREGAHKSLLRNQIPRGKVGKHDVRPTTNISSPSVQYQRPQSEPMSRATQVTVTHRVSPAVLGHTQRIEKSLEGSSSELAGAPFLFPSLRKPSIYANGTDKPLAGLPVAHIFEHPRLLESGAKIGDPVKRDPTPNHRPTNPSAASPTPPPSLAVPALPPTSALSVIDAQEVTYQDILDGLQLGLSAILDSDVDFWVKEVVGTS
ncbi:hypothetical protein VC83_05021 [Pseudogymnoascus destructans]|nr:uncharacterized protein VC83_05021 [Pseudogymnoascus destructans]OAF58655.1 hypothetical protein VC83_05021 [Pseudogymnoascus destructans]